MSKKELEHWKPQQEREENRSNTQRTTIKIVSRREEWRGEESWQQELRHLKERLVGKDQQICRVEPERKRLAEAHVDTLALLSSTQAGLKQEEQRCARLEEQCCKKLADQEQRHQIEIKNQEEGFQREVCENITKTKQMASDLPLCEAIWTETQRKLEEMLWNHEEISGEKETSNRKEIQLLTERIVQLQQLLSEKEQKKKQKSKFNLMKFFFKR
ncbi:golgin subfamily A member 6-like protein 22 [Takifugu rubripes]|uniref:golgin subfamily A member 6-like protein 22 n=1 Tax=Takifugu rubripes TaxID=31033 RepID=UPI001145C2E7|nr:golgin subfamily A member 6-like protein 22 [Takifugu rubripes]